jgi:TPR repeat protein
MRPIVIALLLLAAPACARAEGDPNLVGKLERLAATGNAEALYHLGMSYQTGTGVTQDHQKALTHFRRAETLGDPLAAYKIGCFYAEQDDVLTPDEDQALRYKSIAANAGYALAQSEVAGIYARRGASDAARDWIAKAAAQGTSGALFGFASMHNGKNGLARDGAIVVAYFTLFLRSEEPNEAQRQWLEKERSSLSDAERTRADQIIAAYRPQPSALTLKALSGQRAAEALIARSE